MLKKKVSTDLTCLLTSLLDSIHHVTISLVKNKWFSWNNGFKKKKEKKKKYLRFQIQPLKNQNVIKE